MQADSFSTTEDSVPPWPRSDVCRPRLARNLNSRRLLCSRFTGGNIHRPSLWSKGMVSGSVLFCGRRGCIDQAGDVLFLPLPPCCSTQSHKYTRGKRKTFPILYWSASAATEQGNEGNETTVSKPKISKLQHQFRITTSLSLLLLLLLLLLSFVLGVMLHCCLKFVCFFLNDFC